MNITKITEDQVNIMFITLQQVAEGPQEAYGLLICLLDKLNNPPFVQSRASLDEEVESFRAATKSIHYIEGSVQ